MWVPNHLLTWMILQVQTFHWAFCFMHFYLNPQNVRCVKFVPPSKLIRKQIWQTLKSDTQTEGPGIATLHPLAHPMPDIPRSGKAESRELASWAGELGFRTSIFFLLSCTCRHKVFVTLLKTQVPTGCKRFFPDHYVKLRCFFSRETHSKQTNQ